MTSSWVIWRSLLNQKRHLSKPFSEAVKKFGLLVSGGIAFELVPTNVKHFYKRRTSLAEGSVSGSVDCKRKLQFQMRTNHVHLEMYSVGSSS